MEFFGILAAIVISSIITFIIGLSAMAKYNRSRNKPQIEIPATRNTAYADHVINAAVQIYCNFNESKIIRPGASAQPKKDRYGEALQESLNLVGAAYQYFDIVDQDTSDQKKGVEPHKRKSLDIKIN